MELMGLYTIGASEGERSRDALHGKTQYESTQRDGADDALGTSGFIGHITSGVGQTDRRTGAEFVQKYHPVASGAFRPIIPA